MPIVPICKNLDLSFIFELRSSPDVVVPLSFLRSISLASLFSNHMKRSLCEIYTQNKIHFLQNYFIKVVKLSATDNAECYQ